MLSIRSLFRKPQKARWPFCQESPPLPPTLPGGQPWPKISVITPSYNQAQFVEETILSVLNQNYPNLEYIMMDGGSNDGTKAILEKYADRFAFWVSQKDGGQSSAINQGMSRATGDILTWLNSDDMLAPGALAGVAMAFHTSQADIVAGICELHNGEKTLHQHLTSCSDGPLPLEDLLDLENCTDKGQFFYQPEVFYKRELWQRAGGHVDSSLHWVMDYDLWIRYAIAGAKLKVIGRRLALFRVHKAQKTHNPEKFRAEALGVRDRYRAAQKIQPRAVIPEEKIKRGIKTLLLNDVGFLYGAGIAHRRIGEALTHAGNEVSAIAMGRVGAEVIESVVTPDFLLKVVAENAPDLVILGNLHGLSVTNSSLFPEFMGKVSERYPTIFVTHDLWVITGRCVHMRDCDKFLRGCDEACPTSQEYPKMDPTRIAEAWRAKMQNLSADNQLAIMANSRYVLEKIKGLFGHLSTSRNGSSKIVEQAYLGFPIETFRPIDKTEARRKLNLPQDKFIILFSSANISDKRKGLGLLLEALTSLNLPDLVTVCMGWRDPAQPLPIKDVREMGYVNDPERQALLYSAANLFVAPSLEESFGQVFVEAAACGTPCVGFNTTAIPESIIDGITGRLAKDLTAKALAEAIAELYKNRALLESLSKWAPLFVENEFSIPALYHRVFCLVRKMFEKNGVFIAPNISFVANPPAAPREAKYLDEEIVRLSEESSFTRSADVNSYRRERELYVIANTRLRLYRSSSVPWLLNPKAWAARLERNRRKARLKALRPGQMIH
jgi:glycosyltransferase involved in cell wall biosynthesis